MTGVAMTVLVTLVGYGADEPEIGRIDKKQTRGGNRAIQTRYR